MRLSLISWLNGEVTPSPVDGLRQIVGRYSRGNVLLQQGRYITEKEAARIVQKGDRALERLNRRTKS